MHGHLDDYDLHLVDLEYLSRHRNENGSIKNIKEGIAICLFREKPEKHVRGIFYHSILLVLEIYEKPNGSFDFKRIIAIEHTDYNIPNCSKSHHWINGSYSVHGNSIFVW